MSVALLLITHKKIATSLIDVASSIVNDAPENFACIEVPMDIPTETMEAVISDNLGQLDQSDGTLILTDMYGGTPSNIAKKFAQQKNTRLISGLNLPMLVKIMNYRNLPLTELSEKTLSGGKQGISLYEEGIN
jgi:PTS system ascorbate-specific IIA component